MQILCVFQHWETFQCLFSFRIEGMCKEPIGPKWSQKCLNPGKTCTVYLHQSSQTNSFLIVSLCSLNHTQTFNIQVPVLKNFVLDWGLHYKTDAAGSVVDFTKLFLNPDSFFMRMRSECWRHQIRNEFRSSSALGNSLVNIVVKG